MFDDGFEPFTGDARHLTPQQWTALRKSIVRRADEERKRAIRQMFAGSFGMIRRAWRRIQLRREARAELGSMTDRELWDIGLSRSGIEAAVRQDDADAGVGILRLESARRLDLKQNTHPGPLSPDVVQNRSKGEDHVEGVLDRPRLGTRSRTLS
jgi:uncharacterized protein YjiS (DUF1127 family)